jgi:hypothetical protein
MPANDVKQFGIFVKEGLLDPKHVAAIGEAIWIYLFLLNSVTKVKGEDGLVFGGAPFSISRVNEKIGKLDRMTYWRHMKRLEKAGYITVQRAMRGLIVTVTKSYKIFGDVTERLHEDVTQKLHQEAPRVSDVTQMSSDVTNKLHLLDKTKDKTINTNSLPSDFENQLLEEYNAANGTRQKVIQEGTRKNIISCLNVHSPDDILRAVKNQKRCSSEFLKDIDINTMFRPTDRQRNDVDYIGQILKNYKL